MLDHAIRYATLYGWAVFPLAPRGKTPLTDTGFKAASRSPDTIQKWWARTPEANIGIPTGARTRFDVLDVDLDKGGQETLEQWRSAGHVLPDTVQALTGGGGMHYFFRYDPKNELKNRAGIAPGIDIRTEGGYIVAPPSEHASGRSYAWELSHDIDDVEVCPWPSWLLQLIEEGSPEEELPSLEGDGNPVEEGRRNDFLIRVAGGMRRWGGDEKMLCDLLSEYNQRLCVPPLPQEEVAAIAQSAMRYKAAPRPLVTQPAVAVGDQDKEEGEAQEGALHPFTDMGNASRFVDRYGAACRHLTPAKKWLHWTGTCWTYDEVNHVQELAKATVRAIETQEMGLVLVPGKKDGPPRDLALEHAKKSQAERTLTALTRLASSQSPIPILPEDLDRHPWLLNCKNGTLDLRTGVLQEPDPEDYLTQQIEVEYDPRAEAPRWEQFVKEIFNGSENLANYLQEVIGYALTGDTSEQIFCILWGSGSNGKSILLDLLSNLLGPFAKDAAANSFMDSKMSESTRNDLAALKAARLVTISETNEGQALDESLVKKVAGGDRITSRFLNNEYFTYTPQFKIFMATNNRPVIRGDEHGIWRKIRLFPFQVQFGSPGHHAAEDRNKLMDALRAELPGILAWAVRGALRWQKDGMQTPPEVVVAVNEYKAEQDPLIDFFDECVFISSELTISKGDLYAVYESWSRTGRPMSKVAFSKRMAAKGFKEVRRNLQRSWEGIGLTTQGAFLSSSTHYNNG